MCVLSQADRFITSSVLEIGFLRGRSKSVTALPVPLSDTDLHLFPDINLEPHLNTKAAHKRCQPPLLFSQMAVSFQRDATL